MIALAWSKIRVIFRLFSVSHFEIPCKIGLKVTFNYSYIKMKVVLLSLCQYTLRKLYLGKFFVGCSDLTHDKMNPN